MSRKDKLQSLYNTELDLVREQASLLLQTRSEGFSGELKSAGTIIERYIRGLISHHLPSGYRICSGYIATSDTIHNADNLLQHDAIIVDCRTPSLHKFGFGDIELIPAEAVCGVIEIKKTLNDKSVGEALAHLKKIRDVLEAYDEGNKSKAKAPSNAVGPALSVATRAPLYAIIGLDADEEKMDIKKFESTISSEVCSFLDMIWAPASPFLARIAIKSNCDKKIYVPQSVSRNHTGFSPQCIIHWFDTENATRLYSTAISLLRSWINATSGSQMSLEKTAQYFGVDS